MRASARRQSFAELSRTVNVVAELFVAGRSFAALEELDLSRDAVETGSGVYGVGLFGLLLAPDWVSETASLPRLRVLRVHGNFRLFLRPNNRAYDVVRFLRACPALEELHAADMATFTRGNDPFANLLRPRPLRAVSQHRKPLRIQMLERAPLPAAVDIACGVCGALLWRRLTQFVLAPRFQHQQAFVVYTNVPPEPEDVTFLRGDPMQLMCSN